MGNATKPITMVRDELSKTIVESINNSSLPMFIVEYVLMDILNEVHTASIRQSQEAEQEYKNQINSEKNGSDTKIDSK